MNKMISNMLGKVDFNEIQKQLGKSGGKIDSDMINSVMSSMLGGKNDNSNSKKTEAIAKTETKENDDISSIIAKKSFGYQDICKIIPQRSPFLMIDEVVDLNIEEKRIICKKNLSSNEWFFSGHFPNNPVMPGVLTIEAMAQASSILGKALMKNAPGVLMFAEIENVKFSSAAFPGDVLTIEAKVTKLRDPIIIGDCITKKGDEVICKGIIKAFRKEI